LNELVHRNVEFLVDTSVRLNSHRLIDETFLLDRNHHFQEKNINHTFSHCTQSLVWNKAQRRHDIINKSFLSAGTGKFNDIFPLN